MPEIALGVSGGSDGKSLLSMYNMLVSWYLYTGTPFLNPINKLLTPYLEINKYPHSLIHFSTIPK